MAGIYGVLLKKNKEKQLYNTFYNRNFKNTLKQEICYHKFVFGRSVLKKFEEDRFLFENDDFIICFEGINHSTIKKPSDFIEEYKRKGNKFINDLRGNFSGFIFEKLNEELTLFTDTLASKSIYYFFDEKFGFAFASEMQVLSKLLRENGISINYDYDGIYSLALYGQMFKNYTIVKEIKRLSYGSVIQFSNKENRLHKSKYYTFKKETENISKEEIIDSIDHLMVNAINKEWKKDELNNYNSKIALISGGMDSRVNALIAKKIGYENITGYTFGNPASSDVKIASEIASKNLNLHIQTHLHNGNFFIENILENYVKSNDGLVHFTPSAIIYNVYRHINFSDFGQLHSGQIGDALFGSLLRPKFNFKENSDKIGLTGFVKHQKMIDKINSINEIIEEFNLSDYELFAYQERVVNGALTGDKQINNFIDHSSPFFNRELIDFMLSVPNKFKINQQIYFDWLKAKHPDLLNYRWEKIGLKPNTNFNIKYGRLIKKYVNGGKKYFGLKYDSMNPISIWLKSNPNILVQFEKLFQENLSLIQDEELRQDLTKIYKDDIFEYRNKFAVISVLLAIKLHFYS
ncbi:MAG: asparagine synthase-related protein [Mesonia sp.]|uniref:asparagine synthase-related protein n=1 Tax=Mesonia sp. TaxID=1960830 RepID=UPI003242C9C4